MAPTSETDSSTLAGNPEDLATLCAEVADLREGLEIVEERARTDLGMIRPNEILVQVSGGR